MEYRIKIHVIAEELAKGKEGKPWVMRYYNICVQAKKIFIYAPITALSTGKSKQPRAFLTVKGKILRLNKPDTYAII